MAAVAAGLQGRRYKKAPQTRRTSLDRPPSPTPPPPAALLSAPSAPPAAPSPGDPAAARAGFPAGAPPAQVQDKPDTHILPSVPGAPLTSHHISHPTRIAPTLECTELKARAFEATRLADVDRPRNTRAQTVLKALRGAHSLTPANPALACLIPRGLPSLPGFRQQVFSLYLANEVIEIFGASPDYIPSEGGIQTWLVSAKCDPSLHPHTPSLQQEKGKP